jgi:hypothetical protein
VSRSPGCSMVLARVGWFAPVEMGGSGPLPEVFRAGGPAGGWFCPGGGIRTRRVTPGDGPAPSTMRPGKIPPWRDLAALSGGVSCVYATNPSNFRVHTEPDHPRRPGSRHISALISSVSLTPIHDSTPGTGKSWDVVGWRDPPGGGRGVGESDCSQVSCAPHLAVAGGPYPRRRQENQISHEMVPYPLGFSTEKGQLRGYPAPPLLFFERLARG